MAVFLVVDCDLSLLVHQLEASGRLSFLYLAIVTEKSLCLDSISSNVGWARTGLRRRHSFYVSVDGLFQGKQFPGLVPLG
jgi:hypothetical protein